MKKVALIGLGRWGKNIQRELINLDCEVVSFTYDREEAMNNEFEAVFIATPMSTHFEVAKEFIRNNKKVFLEKPITTRANDAKELIDLVQKNNTLFMVGHIFLYHPCFLALKNELIGKTVTKVTISKTSRGNPRLNPEELFLDSFIHEISILLKLFGTPIETIFDKEKKQMTLNFHDFVATIILLEAVSDEKIRKFEFETSLGNYIWDNDELFSATGQSICKPDVSPLKNELDIFLNHCEERKEEIVSNNEIALKSVEILEKIYS